MNRRRFPAIRPAMAARVCLVLLLWLATLGWLIRFEACPERFTGRFEGYRSLFRGGVVVRSSWMRILADGAPIGYAHTEIDSDERNPAAHTRIVSTMELALNILGQRRQVATDMTVSLDALSRLQRFAFDLESEGVRTQITGTRAQGDQFRVLIKTGGTSRSAAVTIPDEVMIDSPVLQQSLAALKPGQSQTFRMLDPASLAITDVRVRADRIEPIAVTGRTVQATVLAADYQGMTVWTWVDPEGALLRQETPLGWVLELCTPEEAMAFRASSRRAAPELLAAAAVPVDRPIAAPRQVRRLEVRLRGLEIPPHELATDRQEAVADGTNGLRLIVRAEAWPEPGAGEDADPSVFSNALAATPFLQADDPAIRDRARAITARSPDPAAAARAIHDWVFRSVRKSPTVSLPSARAVLDSLEGDCNEHTYLAVALARAVGIPARIMIGLVYMDGAFYYHAWPAVRAGGRWIEMDPTLGQPVADATHLALAEGELAAQTRLLRYLGRLSIDVLAVEQESAP